jgi:murein L,D-transpeptidase YafK
MGTTGVRRGVRSFGAVALAGLLMTVAGTARADRDPVPTTARSRAAVARVRPDLERALGDRGLRFGAPVFLRIFKEERELEVWLERGERFVLFRTYPVCAVSGGLGPKLRVGDLQAPEGFYSVPPARLNPASRFHLAFDLGYPNAYDRAHGRTGGALMVHGDCVSIGCFAMTDAGIEEIYALAEAALNAGQPFFRVHVFPFRMTDENLRRHRDPRWAGFWRNLREGHDAFAATGRPPDVRVTAGRYVFADS